MSNKPHLLESSKEDFEEAAEIRPSEPKMSEMLVISGHELLAYYHLANNNHSFIRELEKATQLKLKYLRDYSEKLYPERQIEYALLCLAINNVDRAIDFCSIDVDYKSSHRFDILLNCKLRRLLGVPLLEKEPTYEPTKSEIGLFEAFDAVINHNEVNWNLLHKYWRATKSKRYELTVFADKDLFSQALRNGEKAFNKGLQSDKL